MIYYKILDDGKIVGYVRSQAPVFNETYAEIDENEYQSKTGISKNEYTYGSDTGYVVERILDMINQ